MDRSKLTRIAIGIYNMLALRVTILGLKCVSLKLKHDNDCDAKLCLHADDMLTQCH